MAELHLTADPAELLERAGDLLAGDPLVSTVVATTVARDLHRRAAGEPPPSGRPYWFAVALEAGRAVGVAMRAAERPPYAIFVLPMPEEHAGTLAALLHERGEDVRAVNGVEGSARALAEAYAARAGGTVRVAMRTRLLRLAELRVPRPVPGGLEPVAEHEADLVARWLAEFQRDVDLQAGRPEGRPTPWDATEVRWRIRERRLWWWRDRSTSTDPVHLLGAGLAAAGVARIAPVHTPPAARGRGYAAAAVASLAGRLAAGGDEVCLFVDRDNPVSCRLYDRLGFEPVTDMVDLLLDSGGHD